MNQASNLRQIAGKIFCPLPHLFVVCCSQFGGPSTSCARIQTTESARFPRLHPMVHGKTIDVKNLLKLCCCRALCAEETTMSGLSHTIMLTTFVDALE